ncbi:hypothetical protein CEXT_476601 [Caerostris extrusa]|uniref:Uncharacterized protein n=1 Tax=Caerostris extrusa TaxID=172846 RepID=A0AAV4P1X1_CAEEX|nr:hypothetical protein CEXT_476601 [Caerostris extrusa]
MSDRCSFCGSDRWCVEKLVSPKVDGKICGSQSSGSIYIYTAHLQATGPLLTGTDEHKPSTSSTPRAYFISPITTHQRTEATQHANHRRLKHPRTTIPFSTDDISTFLQVTPADWNFQLPSLLLFDDEEILLLSDLEEGLPEDDSVWSSIIGCLGRGGGGLEVWKEQLESFPLSGYDVYMSMRKDIGWVWLRV